ncbi:hypothetical protein ACIBL5_00460 [Streptomyces sp. NPDC050516]|uniref:hypothetical protein n=1 Tax=Streptomyces sp. NPDC050516 TaxID=3365621 RepID=UPI0037999E34
MTQNATNPEQLIPARDSEDHGGAVAAIVPHGTDNAQQHGLFPGHRTKPVARPLVVITRGRIETVVRCPGCGDMHRHVGLGDKRGPCGSLYIVRPKATFKGAA